MARAAFPSREARFLALAKIFTTWLWRNGDPKCISPEDVAHMEIISALADNHYDLGDLLAEAEVLAGRKTGLENE